MLHRSIIDDVKSKVSSLGQGTIRQDGDAGVLKSLQDLGGYIAAVHSDVKSLAASAQVCLFSAFYKAEDGKQFDCHKNQHSHFFQQYLSFHGKNGVLNAICQIHLSKI